MKFSSVQPKCFFVLILKEVAIIALGYWESESFNVFCNLELLIVAAIIVINLFSQCHHSVKIHWGKDWILVL